MVALSVSIEGMVGLTWPVWRRLISEIEQLGFAGLYRSDHFTLPFPVDLDSLEMVVSLTYAADHTSRVQIGPLVAPLSFRDPVMLARQASAIDDLSGGRMILGVGAGWEEREHAMFGYELGDLPTRFARFAEGLDVVTRLLRDEEPVTYSGRFFTLHDAVLLPRPQRKGGPPIMVGGSGPRRTLPLVAQFADIWNGQLVSPEQFRRRSEELDQLIKAAGRDPAEVRRTVMLLALVGQDSADLERRLAWQRDRVPMFESMPLDSLVGMFRESLNAFVGTPDELTDEIRRFAAAGADEVMLQWISLGDVEGLQVVAEEVLPAVRSL
jgi:F420-dependent oxidoreductase-like protein